MRLLLFAAAASDRHCPAAAGCAALCRSETVLRCCRPGHLGLNRPSWRWSWRCVFDADQIEDRGQPHVALLLEIDLHAGNRLACFVAVVRAALAKRDDEVGLVLAEHFDQLLVQLFEVVHVDVDLRLAVGRTLASALSSVR